MLFLSYIINHIITYKNKTFHKLIYTLFAPYQKNEKYLYPYPMISEFYINYLRIYKINLKFIYKSV